MKLKSPRGGVKRKKKDVGSARRCKCQPPPSTHSFWGGEAAVRPFERKGGKEMQRLYRFRHVKSRRSGIEGRNTEKRAR